MADDPEQGDLYDGYDDIPRVRRSDPETSHAAAEQLSTASSHCKAMLLAFYHNPEGLTDEEAAKIAGINQPKVCWWHRASDLRQKGEIEWLCHNNGKQVKVRGSAGRDVGISRITEVGVKRVNGRIPAGEGV